jgi:hypothetical protein
MDPISGFTKMTGVMDLNVTAFAVKILHPPNRGGDLNLVSEIFVPCHLGEICKRRA